MGAGWLIAVDFPLSHHDAVSLLLQLIASSTTVLAMWLMGNRSLWGPVVGVLSECVWIAAVIHGRLWGIVPLTVFLIFVNARNFMKWRRDGNASDA